MSIKTYEMCDPENPEEHALWALYCLPLVNAPMLVVEGLMREWAKHLWELGFRHNPELQTKKFLPPARGPHSEFNGAAQWVPLDTPEPEYINIPHPEQLTVQENQALVEELENYGYIKPAAPQLPLAHVKERNGKAQR